MSTARGLKVRNSAQESLNKKTPKQYTLVLCYLFLFKKYRLAPQYGIDSRLTQYEFTMLLHLLLNVVTPSTYVTTWSCNSRQDQGPDL